MESYYKICFVALLLSIGFDEAVSQCNIDRCDTTLSHVCSSENSFLRCDRLGGIPIAGESYQCPEGLHCANVNVRCTSVGQPVCKSLCSICDTTTNIACITKTEFAFCIEGQPIMAMRGKCAERENCVASSASGCASDTTAASCDKLVPEIPPTTPGPTGEPTKEEVIQKCKVAGKIGKFATQNIKKYIYCYIRFNKFEGNIYTCPGVTEFNCVSEQCELVGNNNCISI